MANYRKSFNFRNGVQVDNDNFIVNANGLVGIGTSIPTEVIDAVGNAKISGFTTTDTLGVANTASFYNSVNVGSNVSIDSATGFINASKFIGDASGLTNIYAISTTGWVAQGVGLHTFRQVGIGTTNPVYSLQVGFDPASSTGIGMTSGNIRASGVITATSFVGELTGDVTGNITGNVTGNITGDLTGVASTATQLENARNFSITGDLEASAISFDGTGNVSLASTLSSSFNANTSGIITANTFSGILTSSSGHITDATIIDGTITRMDVGIGTFDSIRVDTTTNTTVDVTGDDSASISVGASVGAGNSSAVIKYTSSTGGVEISNYDTGDVSVLLHEGTGAGTTGGFKVSHNNNTVFNAYYDGRVAINKALPDTGYNLDVNGDAKITGILSTSDYITIRAGEGNQVTVPDANGNFPANPSFNIDVNTGVSTFNSIAIGGSIISSAIPAAVIGIGTITGGDNTVAIGTDNVRINADLTVSSGSSITVDNLNVLNSTKLSESVLGPSDTNMTISNGNSSIVLNADVIVSAANSITVSNIVATGITAGIITTNNLTVSNNVSLPNGLGVSLGLVTTTGLLEIGAGATVIASNFYVGAGNTSEFSSGTVNVFDSNFVFGFSTSVASDSSLNNFEIFKSDESSPDIAATSDSTSINHTNFIGIGTTANQYASSNKITIKGDKILQGSNSLLDNVAIGTNNYRFDPRGENTFTPGNEFNAPEFQYGKFQVHSNGNVTFVNDGIIRFVPSIGIATVGFGTTNGGVIFDNAGDNIAAASVLGINTFFPRCVLDVGYASTAVNSYFLPPVVTESELDIIRNLPNLTNNLGHQQSIEATPDGVLSGALVFNSTNTRLEVGIGTTTFCGIATLSNNHTGFSAFVPPKMTTTQRNTMTTSGVEEGGVVYNTSLSKLQFYNGTSWETITSS
jgi:hypothetical protein